MEYKFADAFYDDNRHLGIKSEFSLEFIIEAIKRIYPYTAVPSSGNKKGTISFIVDNKEEAMKLSFRLDPFFNKHGFDLQYYSPFAEGINFVRNS